MIIESFFITSIEYAININFQVVFNIGCSCVVCTNWKKDAIMYNNNTMYKQYSIGNAALLQLSYCPNLQPKFYFYENNSIVFEILGENFPKDTLRLFINNRIGLFVGKVQYKMGLTQQGLIQNTQEEMDVNYIKAKLSQKGRQNAIDLISDYKVEYRYI